VELRKKARKNRGRRSQSNAGEGRPGEKSSQQGRLTLLTSTKSLKKNKIEESLRTAQALRRKEWKREREKSKSKEGRVRR